MIKRARTSSEATTVLSRAVKIWKFKMLYFQNKRRYGAGNFYKDVFFGHLQPGVHKNSEGRSILNLEFDDVMGENTIFCRNNSALSQSIAEIRKEYKNKNTTMLLPRSS